MVAIPASVMSSLIADRTAKEASKISKASLGFDFIPLISGIVIFYTIAFIFAKFMEASKLATGGFIAFSNLLGFNVPPQQELPNSLNRLFDEGGLNGIKFWDLINIIAIVIIVATAFQFYSNVKAQSTRENPKQVQPITWAIFGILVSFIIVTGMSEIVTRIQQRNFQSDFR